MKFSDLLTGLLLILLGGGVAGLWPARCRRCRDSVYGAGLFPMLIGVCFAGFGAHLRGKAWRDDGSPERRCFAFDDWARDHRLVGNMAARARC